MNGIGVEPDIARAVQLYEMAAAAHYPPAQCNLGLLYEEGRGVEKDQKKAVALYTAAAARGLTARSSPLAPAMRRATALKKTWIKPPICTARRRKRATRAHR